MHRCKRWRRWRKGQINSLRKTSPIDVLLRRGLGDREGHISLNHSMILTPCSTAACGSRFVIHLYKLFFWTFCRLTQPDRCVSAGERSVCASTHSGIQGELSCFSSLNRSQSSWAAQRYNHHRCPLQNSVGENLLLLGGTACSFRFVLLAITLMLGWLAIFSVQAASS